MVNKSIALFMGFVRYFPNMKESSELCKLYYYPYEDKIFPDSLYIPTTKSCSAEFNREHRSIRYKSDVETMPFDSDWNWIMPVLKKIRTLGFIVSIENNACIITKGGTYSNTCNSMVHCEYTCSYEETELIKSIYNAVSACIDYIDKN